MFWVPLTAGAIIATLGVLLLTTTRHPEDYPGQNIRATIMSAIIITIGLLTMSISIQVVTS